MKKEKKLNLLKAFTFASIILFYINIKIPTEYFISDAWYKFIYISYLLAIFILGFILFLLSKFRKGKFLNFIYFGGIPYLVFYFSFFLYSLIGKREIFNHYSKMTLICLMIFSYLIFSLIWIWKKNFYLIKKINEKYLIIFSPLLFFTFFLCIKNIFFVDDYVNNKNNLPISNKRKIIFIVFDELDKEIVYDVDRKNVNFKMLEHLKNNSFFCEKVKPAANATWEAIPSITTGLLVEKTMPFSYDKLILINSEKSFSWKNQENIFQIAKENGYNTACIGWYHRYRRILVSI